MSIESRKDALFADIITRMDQEFGVSDVGRIPFAEWPVTANIILDGRPFSYKKHEYLIEPYNDAHPYQVEMKATQLGLTSKALLRVVYGCRYGEYRGIMYFFPSRTDITDLSKTRLNPLIEDNPDTIGQWIRETDAANIKKIWNSYLYLRGMQSRIGMKSAPSDFNIYDEYDEAPPKAIDMAQERMGHSEIGESLFLSNPTLPDYGIDKLFQDTDMRYWFLKCTKCNEYTDMVGTFPDCLQTVRGGKVIRACVKCGAELDPSIGQWVAKRPSVTERRGRQFSQLFSQSKTTTPDQILHTFHTTNNLTSFYNLKIGIAYVESQNRLSKQEVFDCCGDGGMLSESEEGCFMGVDQGSNLHVTIGRRHEKRFAEVVYIAEHKGNVTDDKADESGWKELDSLMNRFKINRCVVDGLPNKKFARNFAERFPGRVFLSYYNEYQRGSYKWSDKEMMVTANRTETLDASHNEIATCNILLPRRGFDVIDEFATHLHNVAKKLMEDEESGSQQYVYFKLGVNHYRFAYSHMVMAMSAPDLLFGELL